MERNHEGQFVKKVEHTSEIKAVECMYKWTINNYSLCIMDNGKSVNSPNFICEGYTWRLKVYPSGFNEKSKDYVSVQLFLDGFEDDEAELNPIHTFVIMSILNDQGVEYSIWKKNFSNCEFNADRAVFEHFLPKQALIDKKSELLPNDQLTILCKTCISKSVLSKEEEYKAIVKKRRLTEFDDFEKILKKSKFSDVEIVVGDRVFEVHKVILSARSRVFEAMFEQDLKEQNENKIVISDVDAEVMELVLRYMYTGKLKVNELERLRREIYRVADKYELDGLKHVCKDTMIENLSVDNIGDALAFINTLPDSEDVKTLEKKAINFVIEHSSMLQTSESFQETCKSLSTSILTKVINAFMSTK